MAADRQRDDLALRRMDTHKSKRNSNQQQVDMSYLLCSSAYAGPAKIETPTQSELERRLTSDDLHQRQVRHLSGKPSEPEPPFGVPRRQQYLVQTSAPPKRPTQQMTATQRLQQTREPFLAHENCSSKHQPQPPPSGTEEVNKGVNLQLQYKPSDRKRTDSRVSFVEDSNIQQQQQTQTTRAGATSADSGIAAATPAESPIQGATAAAVDTSGVDHLAEVELLELIDDIDKELAHWAASSPCASPAPEKLQAEYRATPTRLRPRIEIAEPRAKSPLLRVGGGPSAVVLEREPEAEVAPIAVIQTYRDSWPRRVRKPMSELEFTCDFDDDDDEDEHATDELLNDTKRPVTTIINTQLNDHFDKQSSTPNESASASSSLDRLTSEGVKLPEKRIGHSPGSIMFSIGQYSDSLKRRQFKIL